jgi:hypothetical protein
MKNSGKYWKEDEWVVPRRIASGNKWMTVQTVKNNGGAMENHTAYRASFVQA